MRRYFLKRVNAQKLQSSAQGSRQFHSIGSTTGNALLLTSVGTIQILSTLTTSNAIETINAPLQLVGSYTFANNGANTVGTLNIGGQISGPGSLSPLALSGSNTNANTISGNINGNLNLNKTGIGTWVLAGNKKYNGPTFINSGTLLVNGQNFGGTLFSVASGGTLGGAGGIITAANDGIALAAGAKLSPGSAAGVAGTLLADVGGFGFNTTSAVAATNSQSLLFDLTTPGASDQVLLSKAFNSGSALRIGTGLEFDDFAFTTDAGFGSGVYTLFDTANTIIATLGANLTGIPGGLNATISFANLSQDIVLTVTAVPEPATYGALAGLALTGLSVTSVIRCRSKKLAA